MNNIDILEELKEWFNNFDLDSIKHKPEEYIQAISNLIAENKELKEKNNELEKKDKVIDLIVNTIVGDRKILKLVCNKIINKKEDECFEQNKLCDDCIKEYFYNKIGGNIDKK